MAPGHSWNVTVQANSILNRRLAKQSMFMANVYQAH
jgi:hypothetical protein